jgi:hypothetical protein
MPGTMSTLRWLLAVSLVCACTQPRSQRCAKICAREADCMAATSSTMPFDEKECIAACAVLELDPDNAARVKKHEDCVHAAPSCPAVLECP